MPGIVKEAWISSSSVTTSIRSILRVLDTGSLLKACLKMAFRTAWICYRRSEESISKNDATFYIRIEKVVSDLTKVFQIGIPFDH
jgi:hypothetical protein